LNSLKKVFYYCLFLFTTSFCFSQEININGIVTDSLNNPISGVRIIVSNTKEDNSIIDYTSTNTNGNYSFTFKQNIDSKSLWLSFRHVSYATQKNEYDNNSQKINIVLKAQSNILEEVILNAKKTIEVKGDTITYNVNGLKKKKDYTIEEVISRIPGVKIANNGQISYNNKIISHLYINGVDLLEGRYNIATRGIPANAVKEIDIMKKHNHARIDKGRTESDNVAFNLVIKKNHSVFFGSGKIDAGLPLLTTKGEVTPILLKEDFQNISSIKANNIGVSLSENGNNLTQNNRLFNDVSIEPLNILNTPNTNGTTISNKYWLDNESLSLTNDALVKKGEELILKANANYSYDNKELQNSSKQVFYFNQDSTTIKRNEKNSLTNRKKQIGLVQELNKKKLYLKNKINILNKKDSGFSDVFQNENPLYYNYNNETLAIKNTTEFKTTIKDKILNSGLLVEYNKDEESNSVTPTVFTNEIPNSINSLLTKQTVTGKQLSIGAYSIYNFKIGKYKSQIAQNINWKNSTLKSNLKQVNEFMDEQLSFPFISDFKLNTFTSSSSFASTLKFGDLSIKLNPEFIFINLNKNESFAPELNKNNNYLFLQPRTSLRYKINHKWDASLSGNYITSVSKFPQLFNGIILKDYDNLHRNPNEVNITRTVFGSAYIVYSNILKGFIFSNNIVLSNSKSAFTFSSVIDENGLIQIKGVKTPNNSKKITNTLNLTKNIFRIIKTDFSYTFNHIRSNQIFNANQQVTTSNNHSLKIDLNIDNNTWYGFSYRGVINFGQIKSNQFNSSNVFLKHNLELDFYTSSKTRINLISESTFTKFSSSNVNNINTLFNTEFYYKPSKKLFLRASLNNIFNEKFFTTTQSYSNFVSQYQFSLRPRQFTIGLNFSF